MPEPKYVIAMGACEITGGLYMDTYIISDGKVKSDDAQVSVVVKRVADISKRDQTDPLKTGKEQQKQQQQTGQGDNVIVPPKILADSSIKTSANSSKCWTG